jgi:hypothetical protein
MAAAADNYSNLSSCSFSSSSSSKAVDFGWGGQHHSNRTWQQWKQQPLYGAAADNTASPAVLDSSSDTAAAAYARGVLEPDTLSWLANSSNSSSLPYRSSHTARRSWGSEDDTGLPEQPSGSNNWQQAWGGPLFGSAADNCTSAAGMSDYTSFSVLESSDTTAAAGLAAVEITLVLAPDAPLPHPCSNAFGGTASRLSSWASDSFWRQQQDSNLYEQPGRHINTSSFAAASSMPVYVQGFASASASILLRAWVGCPTP